MSPEVFTVHCPAAVAELYEATGCIPPTAQQVNQLCLLLLCGVETTHAVLSMKSDHSCTWHDG